MVDDIKPGNPDEHTPAPEDATKLTVTDENDTPDDTNTDNNAPSTDEAPTEEITEETTEEKPLTPETDDLAADIAVMETPEGGDTKTDEPESEETESEETETTPTEESTVEESPAEDTQHESDQQEEKPDEEPAEENPQENEEEKSDEQSVTEPAEPQTVAVAEGTDATTAEADPLGNMIDEAKSDEAESSEQSEETDSAAASKPDEDKEVAAEPVSQPAEEETPAADAPEPETLQAVDVSSMEDSGKNEPATPPVMPGQAVEATPEPEAEQKPAEKQVKEEKKAAKKAKAGNGMNLVIVLAVLVAFLLIGLAFVALQSDDEAVSDLNSQTSDISETSQIVDEDVNSEPVDEAEVQEQINGIDETLEALDESEFSEDELSDESLGL